MGSTTYDAVVIGAGPAGCMAALSLARRGLRTLLVERAERGRWKVCGCCLGSLGQAALRQAGMHDLLARASALQGLTLAAHGRSATMPLRGFVSISREVLDAGLADAAEHAGATVRWSTRAQADPSGEVALDDGQKLRARVVIDASGLRGQPSRNDSIADAARIGLGLTAAEANCPPGELTMAVARGGYLGRVGLPGGSTDFAAAVLPQFVRSHGSPTNAARAIWREAGLDPSDVPEGHWRGTPALSRSRSAQDGRILRVGDAAGYVEPFTGEGMSWAMHAAVHVAEDALACVERGPESSRWPHTLRALLASRHARCLAVSLAVRRPTLVAAGLRVVALAPRVGSHGAALLSGAHGRLRMPA